MILGVCYVSKSVLVTKNTMGRERAFMFQMCNLRHKAKYQQRNWSFQSYEIFFGLFEKAERKGGRNGGKEEGGSESQGVSRSYSLSVIYTIPT